jgi:hypothetical protein
MATRARPAQLRVHPRVAQFRAGQARRAARTAAGPGRERPYRWPADRQAIITETLPLPALSAPAEGPTGRRPTRS